MAMAVTPSEQKIRHVHWHAEYYFTEEVGAGGGVSYQYRYKLMQGRILTMRQETEPVSELWKYSMYLQEYGLLTIQVIIILLQ